MQIELKRIKVKDLIAGFVDSDEEGVKGFYGKLNIRPKYQREFVYKEEQAKAVIKTITKGFPLNVMYWVMNNGDDFDDENATFELLDGQQRTISICRFVCQAMYSDVYFNSNVVRGYYNLTSDEREKIDNYELMVYICKGNDSERLDWFRTINIAGLKLTEQELRNAQFTGMWLTDAKRHFSKNGCAGYGLGKDYINGECDRQAYLEEALDWISNSKNQTIDEYMKDHQNDTNCNELWMYYSSVITWIETIFTKKRKEMRGLPWGIFYNKYKDNNYDAVEMENKIKKLLLDDEVTSKKGIYEYVLSNEEKHLNLRAFSDSQKLKAYENQHGICPRCVAMNKPTKNKVWRIEEMEGDHITPWHEGGKTEESNCQMLCKACNREKGGR